MKLTKDSPQLRDNGSSWQYTEEISRYGKVTFFFTDIDNNCKLLFCTNINHFNSKTASAFDNALSKSNRVVVQMVFTNETSLNEFKNRYSQYIVFAESVRIGYLQRYQHYILMLNPYSTYDGSKTLREILKIKE